MRAGLESRTLLLLALVLFNLLTPGIMLQHATSSNAKSSTPAKPSANLQPSEAYLGGGTVGQARLEATVDVATLPSSRGITPSYSSQRLLSSQASYIASAPTGTQSSPVITSPSSPSPSSVTLLTGFEGLSQAQGAGVPPDVSLSVGPDNVVEMVNNVGGVFSKQGASIRTFYLIAFFQVSSGYTSVRCFEPEMVRLDTRLARC